MLLVSLELEEVLSLSDRILVMYEGRIVGEFPPGVSEEELGVAMTGGGRHGGGVSETRPPARREPRGERGQGRGPADRPATRRTSPQRLRAPAEGGRDPRPGR